MVFSLGSLYAMVWGAYRLLHGSMTFGALTAVLQLVNQVQTPFASLSSVVPQYYSMIASAERLMELENLKNDMVADSGIECDLLYKNLDKIVFTDVTFHYDERNRIIENFNYEIKKEEFIAIKGISGIGKSTLLKLLLGVIVAQSGKIELVLKDGKTVPVDNSTRGLFAYVPQGNMILSGTIKDNIRFFKEDITDEDIKNACTLSGMDAFLTTLPDGLDTVIGEKGIGLSEGQVQRIAIARALISGSPVLLLDESTSALDSDTEKDVLTNIKNLHEKTCIIVSHKQAAFDICDKIIGF